MTSLLLVLALAIPNLRTTPGVVRPMTQAQVCAVKWGKDHRHVTDTMKRRVAAVYGVRWVNRRAYEFDHLVPRELGGADDVRNLWPQPLVEAHQKDVLENQLKVAVCKGTVTLAAAQDEMRHWGR